MLDHFNWLRENLKGLTRVVNTKNNVNPFSTLHSGTYDEFESFGLKSFICQLFAHFDSYYTQGFQYFILMKIQHTIKRKKITTVVYQGDMPSILSVQQMFNIELRKYILYNFTMANTRLKSRHLNSTH